MQKTAGIIILSYFIKSKSQCTDYETLAKQLKTENFNPNGVYSYVRYYVNKGYLETKQFGRKKIVCMKDDVRKDLQMMLKIYEKETR